MNSKTLIRLGSLFDGIGGFPYAGTFFGIEPVWASEILPSAVSVTRRNLPGMAHVGDITQLKGGELPPVDIITFGSPCQGLSYAGKRLGLADERSGLFSEAIRIIREMREATNGKYPRYLLWENVPGALSSGRPAGSDFKSVLEAFTETGVPFPRSGRWANAGMVRGAGVDLAWCVYNAQHFGTAQRRRRIFLVVDFGGGCAGEILFIPHSLRGYFEAGGTPRQGPAAYAQRGAGGEDHPGDKCLTPWDVQSRRIHAADGTWPALYGGEGGGRGYCLNPWDTQQSRITTEDGVSPTLAGADGCGGRNPAGLVFTAGVVSKGNGDCFLMKERHTSLTSGGGQAGQGYPCVLSAAFFGKAGAKSRSIGFEEERSPTLTENTPSVVCLNDQGGSRMDVEKGEQAPTLRSVTKGNLPVICRATALANAETLEDKSATLTCYHEQPIICKAVHQNQVGDISTSDTAYTLSTASNANARNAPLVMTEAPDAHTGHPFPFVFESHGQDARYSGPHAVAPAVTASYGMGGGNIPLTVRETEAYGINATAIGRQPHNGGNGLGVKKEVSPTLTAADRHGVGGFVQPEGLPPAVARPEEVHPDVSGTLCASGAGLSRPAGMASETDLCVVYCLQGNMLGRDDAHGPEGSGVNEDVSYTLNTRDQHGVAAVDCRNFRESEELSGTLQAKESGGYSLNSQNPVRAGYIVRRLTPTECERLQGYPDGWTALDENGKPISDSKRYQMLGNSVAVPCVAYILMGMAERLRSAPDEQNPPNKHSG